MLHVVILAMGAFSPALAVGTSIPQWAREYGVTCSRCHVSVPRLNQFGAAFMARGYRMPPDSNVRRRATVPLALWISGRADTRPPGATIEDRVLSYLNRVEVISGGPVIAPWLSYFVEWRPVSQEVRSDGSTRDRGGRFEDLFVTATRGPASVTLGQFRLLDQVDVSRRLGVNEPLVFSSGVGGLGTGTARQVSLRGFAPSGRSPAVRVGWQQPAGRWSWTALASIPIPGELSVPLSDEARVEASNELEWRPKGVFAESYLRAGASSVGAHAFVGERRSIAHAVMTGRRSTLYWTAAGGVANAGQVTTGRWSLEAELIPSPFVGFGSRVEDRAADGASVSFLPYVNISFPATRGTFRLTIERRVQRQRNGTFIELGTVF